MQRISLLLLAFVFINAVLLAGCEAAGHHAMGPKDIPGFWKNISPDTGAQSAMIVFSHEGSYTASNLSGLRIGISGLSDTTSGRWSWKQARGTNIVEIRVREGSRDYLIGAVLINRGGAKKLRFWIGDPDSGEFIDFEKIGEGEARKRPD